MGHHSLVSFLPIVACLGIVLMCLPRPLSTAESFKRLAAIDHAECYGPRMLSFLSNSRHLSEDFSQELSAVDAGPSERSPKCLLLRSLLLLGIAVSVGTALAVSQPSAAAIADPALARLLRGMALIKAVVTLTVAAAVLWRFGRSVSLRATAAYLGGVWLMAAANVCIWQLRSIGAAAVAFHVAMLGVLVVAWREDRSLVVVSPRSGRTRTEITEPLGR